MHQSLDDTNRLCLHTITTRPLSIDEAVKRYSSQGVKGITVWREALEGHEPVDVGRRLWMPG